MPLDGSDYERTDPLHRLDAAIRLIDHPDNWLKGALVDDAGRRCITGALQAVQAPAKVLDAIGRSLPYRYWYRIASFNDAPETTHDDVMRVLSAARVRLGGGPIPGFAAPRSWWQCFRFFESPHG
jgi:hypothetical protein